MVGPFIELVLRVMVVAAAVIHRQRGGFITLIAKQSDFGVNSRRSVRGDFTRRVKSHGSDSRVVSRGEVKIGTETNRAGWHSQTGRRATRENRGSAILHFRLRRRSNRRISCL